MKLLFRISDSGFLKTIRTQVSVVLKELFSNYCKKDTSLCIVHPYHYGSLIKVPLGVLELTGILHPPTPLTSNTPIMWYIVIREFPKIGGPQYTPQNTIVLITGAPKKVSLILGNLKP